MTDNKKRYEKKKFSDCTQKIQKEVLDNMKHVKWNEKIDGSRDKIIVTFKDGTFYGYGLV